MTSVANDFKNAELALAAYAEGLTLGIPNTQTLIDAGMSLPQATRFAATYTVVTQFNSPTGASATVFKDASGQKYLAIRGTQGLTDYLADYLILNGLPLQLNPQYVALKTIVNQWLTDGTLKSTFGDGSTSQQFTVAGHSLGGYLAAGITADFATNVTHAYLYNAPGNNSTIQTIAQALGLAAIPDPSKITSLRADAGISPIASLGNTFATPIPIVIENQLDPAVLPTAPLALNHSQQVLTDALSFYAALATLAPSMGTDQIGTFLKAASAQNSKTLETALDALRKTLLGQSIAATPTGNRDTFYTNLKNLQDSFAFTALAGKVQLVTPTTNGTVARTDFGQFLALYNLTPFVLAPNSSAALDILKNANPTLATAWQADAALTPAQRAAGLANYSDLYLADRAAFLSWLNQGNPIDKDYAASPNANSYAFEDTASGQRFDLHATWLGIPTDLTPSYIRFGADGNDTLSGENDIDHLYGGFGDDTLSGNGGNDWLEGGAGNDTLTGDAGNDTLLGGTGNDTYLFVSGAGYDTIEDRSGTDIIRFDDVQLTGGAQYGNIWRSDDLKTTYTLLGSTENGQPVQTLLISGSSGQVQVKHWEQGRFGINLTDAVPVDPLPTYSGPTASLSTTFQAEAHTVIDASGQGPLQITAIGDYGEVTGAGQLIGNDFANYLHNEDGDDELRGNGGNDVLIATGGNDHLYGGTGNDALQGGTGDDYLEGNEGSDLLAGGIGADVLDGGDG
ncbi:MAG: hypothetical protein WAO76_08710, partial [Georgfuchsia sp.]